MGYSRISYKTILKIALQGTSNTVTEYQQEPTALLLLQIIM